MPRGHFFCPMNMTCNICFFCSTFSCIFFYLSYSHFPTLPCILASCEIVLTKRNHLCQPLKIGYQDLMALKYKQNKIRVRVKRVYGLFSSWFVSPGLHSRITFCSLSDSEFKILYEISIFVVDRERGLLICNRKETTIIFITCRLGTCSEILFVLPLPHSFSGPVS